MFGLIAEAIEHYAYRHTSNEPELLRRLREETYSSTTAPQMQVGLIEGRFLQMLVSILGAKRVLEIGTFTGYSALMMAAALPDDGLLITCDIDPFVTGIARRYFDESGYGHKIEIRLAPALETLSALEDALFDMAFIDADKANYPKYYEHCLRIVRPGGLIVADNVLWSGRVLSPTAEDIDTNAIIRFNQLVQQDDRVENVCLTVRDGIMLIRKK
ncbi:MAG: class I SAM-dependent methyltransferase [Acidobacteriota bacterium]|nr:class I SAM-dependent methyltransferase [Blastocatellia bacterium]MDW8411762.1 class I SAM-dependent methyltransferase [Acidobacteriota bacterium]